MIVLSMMVVIVVVIMMTITQATTSLLGMNYFESAKHQNVLTFGEQMR